MTNVRVAYQTIEFGKTDIHLCTLRNKQEFDDPDGEAEALGISSTFWPIFGLLWPSSLVLAHHLNDMDVDGKRILEVGCGTALTSLLLNKKQADITATDHHPEVERFLNRNTTLNGDDAIPYERTDWADEDDALGLFDMIVGSDLLYDDAQVSLLANFINVHAKHTCEVIIVDPGRGRKNKLTKAMQALGYTSSRSKPADTDYLADVFSGDILRYTRH